MIEDRLDEKTARRIAIGRLDTARKDARDLMRVLSEKARRSKNSKVRAAQFVELFLKSYGPLVLHHQTHGRTTYLFLAQPMEGGACAVDLLRRNTRSDSFKYQCLLYLTPHATARLMERRRSAKVEALIREEFGKQGIMSLMEHLDKFSEEEKPLETTNGHFVVKADDEGFALLAAKTWIPK